jgi:hypothetical protein
MVLTAADRRIIDRLSPDEQRAMLKNLVFTQMNLHLTITTPPEDDAKIDYLLECLKIIIEGKENYPQRGAYYRAIYISI